MTDSKPLDELPDECRRDERGDDPAPDLSWPRAAWSRALASNA